MTIKSLRTGSFGTPKYSEAAVSIENLQEESGVLVRAIVSAKSAGDIIFYDATSGNDANYVVATIDTTNTETSYELGIQCANGIRWVKTGTAKVTVVYI